MRTFDERGRLIEDQREPGIDYGPHRERSTAVRPMYPELGEMIDDAVNDAASDVAQLAKLAVIGVAALYIVPRLLDQIRER